MDTMTAYSIASHSN